MKKIDTARTLTVLALAALIAFFIFKAKVFLLLCAAILALNSFDNRAARFLARLWHKLGTFLGTVNSRIILFLLFYLVLTPLAFAFRTMSKKTVDSFFGDTVDGYFSDNRELYAKDFFERPW
jgi:hypothetical protein